MTFLLDTNVWLWMALAPKSFGAQTRILLSDRANDLVFSAASAWEIVVKSALGKLKLPLEATEYLRTRQQRSGTRFMPVLMDHVMALASLEPIHRDPFDRMLAAQALTEGYTLLTSDERLLRYPIVTFDARR